MMGMMGRDYVQENRASVKQTDITLDNTMLNRVQCTKFVGVLIDESLTWKTDSDCTAKTNSRNIGIMIPGRILHTR